MQKHHVFLVHGITDLTNVPRDFKDLTARIRKHFRSLYKVDPDNYLEFVPVSWDNEVGEGERAIYERCFGQITPTDRTFVTTTFNPIDDADFMFEAIKQPRNQLEMFFSRFNRWRGWRYFSTLFMGHMIAYSHKSDNGIRRAFWSTFKKHLLENSPEVPTYSIVGHSIGAVISFDFLFELMTNLKLFQFGEGSEAPEHLDKLQAKEIRNAFRNFYSMGSPISLFLMRRKELWSDGSQKRFAKVKNPFEGTQNRWMNFLSTDDVVAYPVQALFGEEMDLGQKANPQDVYVENGLLPPWAHINYWRNESVAKEIARSIGKSIFPTGVAAERERELAGSRTST